MKNKRIIFYQIMKEFRVTDIFRTNTLLVQYFKRAIPVPMVHGSKQKKVQKDYKNEMYRKFTVKLCLLEMT